MNMDQVPTLEELSQLSVPRPPGSPMLPALTFGRTPNSTPLAGSTAGSPRPPVMPTGINSTALQLPGRPPTPTRTGEATFGQPDVSMLPVDSANMPVDILQPGAFNRINQTLVGYNNTIVSLFGKLEEKNTQVLALEAECQKRATQIILMGTRGNSMIHEAQEETAKMKNILERYKEEGERLAIAFTEQGEAFRNAIEAARVEREGNVVTGNRVLALEDACKQYEQRYRIMEQQLAQAEDRHKTVTQQATDI